jgi:CRISPR-associated protein Cas5t
MRVLRVEMDGVTTSFRHPHFLIGRQPSYALPPPATILGHVASALGEWPAPGDLRFAYSFQCAGKVDDLENIYATEIGGSVPREDRARWPYPVNVAGTMNPVPREILFQPHLTLYLNAPVMLDRLYAAFREPRYLVVLGRSQDLACYRSVEIIETEDRDAGYLQGTLVHWGDRQRFRLGAGMVMPRFIDPEDRRRVIWSPYLLLEGRAFLTPPDQSEPGAEWVAARADERFVVDPESPPTRRGLRRILNWHSFTADEDSVHDVHAQNR